MLNKTGITKTTGNAPVQILFNVQNQLSVGVILDKTATDYDMINGRKIVRAGTPLNGDLEHREVAFAEATTSGETKGVFTLQITTAFVNDDVLTIEGVNYTKKAAESVTDKQFAGSTAAEQVTSLLKMVTSAKYSVAAVGGATDKLGFTQKAVDVADTTGPAVTKTATTGAIGSVTKVTNPVAGTSNANAVLLHDVDITDADANATALIWGFVNLNRLPSTSAALIDSATKTSLRGLVTFLKD